MLDLPNLAPASLSVTFVLTICAQSQSSPKARIKASSQHTRVTITLLRTSNRLSSPLRNSLLPSTPIRTYIPLSKQISSSIPLPPHTISVTTILSPLCCPPLLKNSSTYSPSPPWTPKWMLTSASPRNLTACRLLQIPNRYLPWRVGSKVS